MASSYPVRGYRAGASGYSEGGFQSRAPGARIGSALEGALRQSLLDAVLQETDRRASGRGGFPDVPRSRIPQAPDPLGALERMVGRRALYGVIRAAGLAARLNPVLRTAFTLWDLYQLLQAGRDTAGGYSGGWEVTKHCGSPSRGPWPQGFVNCVNLTQSLLNEGKIKKAAAFVSRSGYTGFWDRYEANFVQANGHADAFGNWVAPAGESIQLWQQAGSPTPPSPTYVAPVHVPARYLPLTDPFNPPIPGRIRALDPHFVPPLSPAVDPEPLDWRSLPMRREDEGRVAPYRWSHGPTFPVSAPPYFPPGSAPDARETVSNGPTIVIRPDGSVETDTRPINQPPPRPRKRSPKKEKKVAVTYGKVALGLLGKLTEAADFIRAVHDALPYQCRKSRFWDAERHRHRWTKSQHTPQRMLADIKKCWDHVDWEKALKNAIANEVNDFLIGSIGARQAKANRGVGRAVGLGAGGTFRRGPQVPDDSFGTDSQVEGVSPPEKGPSSPGEVVAGFVVDVLQGLREGNVRQVLF